MRVLHYSTWKERCGIAAYAEDLVNALAAHGVQGEVHAVNKHARRYMTPAEVRADLTAFCDKARDHDLVHIQHEFSFFNDAANDLGRSLEQFAFVLRRFARERKPVVVTFHTEPGFLVGLRPTVRAVLRSRIRCRPHIRRYRDSRRWSHTIAGFFGSSAGCRAIVHSRKTKLRLASGGFRDEAIEVVPLGLVQRDRSAGLATPREDAKQQLGYPRDSILLSLFGFVAAYKGPELALRALRCLPENYHLAIVGGPHPEANDYTLNQVLGMACNDPDLRRRVWVTGFVTQQQLDLYHAATDVCLAPYQNTELSGSSALTWALSSGRPVVASKIPSFQEVQERGDCLLMFTEGAEYELAWQVERLLADPHMQATLVRKSLAYVEQNSWPEVARITQRMYEAMTGRVDGQIEPATLSQAA